MSEYWYAKVQLLEQELAQTCKCRFDPTGNPKHVCDYHKHIGEYLLQIITKISDDKYAKDLKKYLYRLGIK